MLLVIFGAGATYDAVNPRNLDEIPELRPPQPPLASELFAVRPSFGQFIDRYGPLRAIIDRMRDAAVGGTTSIEHEFESIVSEAADNLTVRRQLAGARFYLHDGIEDSTLTYARAANGVTNYHVLVDRINAALASRPDSVTYVTFNYDRLLEQAIKDTLRRPFRVLEDYVRNDRPAVIKLHGSVGWTQVCLGLRTKVDRTDQVSFEWLMDRIDDIRLSVDEYRLRPWDQVDPGEEVGFPAITVPTERKTANNFTLPPAHLAVLRQRIPQVLQVLVVGWRGHEEHFWELWDSCHPPRDMRVVVVDKDEASAIEVSRHLLAVNLSAHIEPVPVAGFTSYIAAGGLPGLVLG
jgi:hypothetical protein